MGVVRVAALTAALTAAVTATGCAETTVGPADTVAPEVAKASARRLARMFERHRVVARDVTVHATLWDYALMVGERKGEAQTWGEGPTELRSRLSRWSKAYVADHTTVTVVIEAANRRVPDGRATDPMIDPERWTFRLDRPGAAGIAPERVELQGIDRFPTMAGGYHYRVAIMVRFPGNLHDAVAAGKAGRVRLRIRNRTPMGKKGRRSELGSVVARRGVALSWWVTPSPTPTKRSASTAVSSRRKR